MEERKLIARQAVGELVRRFADQEQAYMAAPYNETQTRREFIDPLFYALEWDIDNRGGLPEAYKDVVHEDALRVEGSSRAPDYGFRIGGVRKFFVEAKKPSVNVKEQVGAAFQVRRYAWSATLQIAVLTDFEEFAVYDCRVQPLPDDAATTARVIYLRYTDYLERWDELWDLLSREAVDAGAIEQFVSELSVRRGRHEVDQAFLVEIEQWRDLLAANLARNNKSLSSREVNAAVQATIDRIVFLRICEARGIEPEGQLAEVARGSGIYARLRQVYLRADDKYNSGLFHFRDEPGREADVDTLTLELTLDDEPLERIIGRLYYPNSPYEFSVLPTDILGQVYEQFLGRIITLNERHEAVVETKPEVRRAGGVYYTPSRVAGHIVHDTLGPLVSESTPRRIASLRIVDPACGSGSFLLAAFEFLLQWHRDYYAVHRPERHTKEIFRGPGGQWLLTSAEKRRILLNNIFGVDLDPQAVEVTKLSLLLKVLEGESSESLNSQLQLLQERALPDLDRNIRWGNSLVGTEIYATRALEEDPEEEVRVRPFEWKDEFPLAFANGGFDAVVGNPPWLMAGYYVQSSLDYFRTNYATAAGKFDLYYLFLERAMQIVRDGGRIGMIVPNKFFHTGAAASLRRLIGGDRWLRSVLDFRDAQLFRGATNYSCILALQAGASEEPEYARADAALNVGRRRQVPWDTLSEEPWFFLDRPTRELFDRVAAAGEPLEVVSDRFGTGVQSGADRILVLEPGRAASEGFETLLLRPFVRGRDVRRFQPVAASRVLVFPYAEASGNFDVLPPEDLAAFSVTERWLLQHRDGLAKRVWFGRNAEELSGQWYGLMYVDSPSSFSRPHLLTPSLSAAANFSIGNGALFATGTAGVTSVIPKANVQEDLGYLLALLNSRLLETIAIAFSPIFSGGYFKFSAPYIRRLPIRRINYSDPGEVRLHDELVDLVKRRMALGAADDASARRNVALEREIDRIVYQLYGLTEDDLDVLEGMREN